MCWRITSTGSPLDRCLLGIWYRHPHHLPEGGVTPGHVQHSLPEVLTGLSPCAMGGICFTTHTLWESVPPLSHFPTPSWCFLRLSPRYKTLLNKLAWTGSGAVRIEASSASSVGHKYSDERRMPIPGGGDVGREEGVSLRYVATGGILVSGYVLCMLCYFGIS